MYTIPHVKYLRRNLLFCCVSAQLVCIPVLQTFQMVLAHLQQQNVTRLQSAKPGLLGMAPHMPHNNLLLNPNMQVALLAVILASQIQQVRLSTVSHLLKEEQ